jgi:glyoxylase-like metal-dependent hydrolase (beta-lactamase superfamily II)
MIIETLAVGALQCNCTILGCERTREAAVIDPGDDAARIFKILDRHKLALKWLLHTHAHFDHVGATKALQEATGAVVCLHPEDVPLYDNLALQTAYFGFPAPAKADVGKWLQDGEALVWGDWSSEVLHTPGHTPGSVTFHLPTARGSDPPRLFTGDTLFFDSIGRTDLWGGDFPTILRSIRERLLTFDDDTLVIPGHGPATTIGRERRENPFLTGQIF